MSNAKQLMQRLGSLCAAFVMTAQVGALADTVRQDNPSVGQELHLPTHFWSDSTVPTKGIIVAIHGATLYAKRFDYMAKHLASEGYPVFAADMRGFGAWRTDTDAFGGDPKIHYTQTEGDLVEVLSMVKRLNPDKPVYALGESLGANLAVWVASTHPDLVDGIILSSPCVKRFMHPCPRVAIDFAKGLWHPYKELSLEPHIKPYLSDDPRVTEEYLKDPVIYRNLSPADLIKSVKTNKLTLLFTQKIPAEMPVLIIAGKKDKIYKASAIPNFASKMGSHNKSIHIVENRGHLLLEHNFVDPRVVGMIDEWLSQNTPQKDKIVREPSL